VIVRYGKSGNAVKRTRWVCDALYSDSLLCVDALVDNEFLHWSSHRAIDFLCKLQALDDLDLHKSGYGKDDPIEDRLESCLYGVHKKPDAPILICL
jgi:hypothetical protein